MADTLEWDEIMSMRMWRLRDTRGNCLTDTRILIYIVSNDHVTFFPVYESAASSVLPKPEGMSIDQLKDWAMNQFLLLRES